MRRILDGMIEAETKRISAIPRNIAGDPTFLPIHLTGGIGDVIMSLDALRKLKETYTIVVYTHHIEAFKYFCSDITAIKETPNFTWKLEFNTTAKLCTESGFTGFLMPEHKELFDRQKAVFTENPTLEALVNTHYEKFFLISRYAIERGIHRKDFPMHTLGLESNYTLEMLPRLKTRNYITVHDGFDVHNRSIVSGRATKQWDWDAWNILLKSIKKTYPRLKIIQLGASATARPLYGVDECLIDKTTISEAFDIIRHSRLHVDGDSGLVHAATRMQVPCVVIWGPTPSDFYGYTQNVNLRSNICSQACYGIKKNWNDKCPIGYNTPKCMDATTPDMALKKIQEILK